MKTLKYIALRKKCGLSVQDAALFHGVDQDTIKRWDNVAADSKAASDLLRLWSQIQNSARNAYKLYVETLAENPGLQGADLYQYDALAYSKTVHCLGGLPHGAHEKILFETVVLFEEQGIPVNIVRKLGKQRN